MSDNPNNGWVATASKWIQQGVPLPVVIAAVIISLILGVSVGPTSLQVAQNSATALAPTGAPTATQVGTATPAPTASLAPTATLTVTAGPTPTVLPTASPSSTPSGVPGPFGLAGSWHLVFDDEFNGSSLDTSKWTPNWLGGSNTQTTPPVNSLEQSCYAPSHVKVANGNLILNATADQCVVGSKTYSYTSGLVTSYKKFEYTYGAIDVYAMPSGGSTHCNNWSAAWINGDPVSGRIENDLYECLGGTPEAHINPGSIGMGKMPSGNPYGGTYHHFVLDWENGAVSFYYDGTRIGTTSAGSQVYKAESYIILNLGISSNITTPVVLPDTFSVDYVRVYQH